jgi:hypothetical protein
VRGGDLLRVQSVVVIVSASVACCLCIACQATPSSDAPAVDKQPSLDPKLADEPSTGLPLASLSPPQAPRPGCYSPTHNIETAYQEGSIGCPCMPGRDQGVCVTGQLEGRTHLFALICKSDGHWQAVQDGPCMPPIRARPR